MHCHSNRSTFEKVIAKIQRGPDFVKHGVYCERSLKVLPVAWACFFVIQMIVGLLCIMRVQTAVSGSIVSVPVDQPVVSRRASTIRYVPVSTFIRWLRLAICTDRGQGTTSTSWAVSFTTTTNAEVEGYIYLSSAHCTLAYTTACIGLLSIGLLPYKRW